MNIDDLFAQAKAPTKVSRTDGNVANQIRAHLMARIPEALEVDGIWISGSNVWKFLYGEVPDVLSDIDVIAENETARRMLVIATGARHVTDCKPSLPCDVQGNGSKYEAQGRTIDIWETGDGVLGSLSRYPDHSHAHCRAAYNCKTGVLIVLPNTKAQ